MPVVFVVDASLSMRSNSFNNNTETLIDACSNFVTTLINEFKKPYYHYISFYKWETNSLKEFIFGKEDFLALIRQYIKNLECRGEIKWTDVLKFCDAELNKMWGSHVKNTIIILTDEGAHEKIFDNHVAIDLNFRSIVHVISFSNEIHSTLSQVAYSTGGVSLSTKLDWNILELTTIEVAYKMLNSFLASDVYHLWPSSADIEQGHFKVTVKLFPFVDLENSLENSANRFQNNVTACMEWLKIKIIGFMALADLCYPCSISDHHITYSGKNHDGYIHSPIYYIQLLNTGLMNTKSAAICTVNYREKLTTKTSQRYGFIRNITLTDAKYSLKFCLFPKEFDGLPWIGKFSNLINYQLLPESPYNSVDKPSPFPIKLKDDCSYKLNDDNQYQYTTWVTTSNSVANDFGKIIRISKRLPERKAIFFKEINRFKETALAIGSPSLLSHLCRVLEREIINNMSTNVAGSSASTLTKESQDIIKYAIDSLTNSPFALLQSTVT